VLVVIAFVQPCAAAVVLDFKSFRQEDALIHHHPGIIELNGFKLTSIPPPANALHFSSAGAHNPLYAGSTGLWNGQS
jgi:hypothetical protein